MILTNKKAPSKSEQVKSASPKKRGRPAGVRNKTTTYDGAASPPPPPPAAISPVMTAEKQPGDVSFPLTCWSLTVTKSGGDIHTSLLDNMNQFLQDNCTRGLLLIMKIKF